MGAFRSEWIKLTRRNTLLGFGGAMIGFTLLFTVLLFVNLGGGEMEVSAGMLAGTDGSIFAITNVASFLGVIALALFASNLAGEFNKGTIRMLFVTEPNRLKVLTGKLAALGSFVAVGVAASLVASVGMGALLAGGAGVDTTSWWTATGLATIGAGYLNLTGAVFVAGLIGATLAVLTRSAAIAISVGAVYFILGEALIATFWEPLGKWGPAAVSNVLATGGTPGMTMGVPRADISFVSAVIVTAGYAMVSTAIASAVLVRRDVTS